MSGQEGHREGEGKLKAKSREQKFQLSVFSFLLSLPPRNNRFTSVKVALTDYYGLFTSGSQIWKLGSATRSSVRTVWLSLKVASAAPLVAWIGTL
jgi:hypothetical protein